MTAAAQLFHHALDIDLAVGTHGRAVAFAIVVNGDTRMYIFNIDHHIGHLSRENLRVFRIVGNGRAHDVAVNFFGARQHVRPRQNGLEIEREQIADEFRRGAAAA